MLAMSIVATYNYCNDFSFMLVFLFADIKRGTPCLLSCLSLTCFMKILILVIVIWGVFLTTRYISFACTKWYLFSLRDSICIEGFRQKQKAGDVITASYSTTAALAHLWGAIMWISCLFNFSISSTVLLTTSCIVCALLLLQVVCRYAIDRKYDLNAFYNAVVEFKRNEKVVGEDNDYEVRFIQTYNEIKSEK